MALRFVTPQTRKRNQVVAIDLGERFSKAVHLQRKGEVFSLLNFVIQDAPIYEKQMSPGPLGDHLKALHGALNQSPRQVSLAVGAADALLRQAEMPLVPVDDLRMMLKFNAKNYLQQDLPDYQFDCFILASSVVAAKSDLPKQNQKCKALVGGARRQFIQDLQTAVKAAGLTTDHIVPGLIGLPNAFELAQPEAFLNESVALVDIGFKHTSVSILRQGEVNLTRVVPFGGDKLTAGLAENLGVPYAEAERLKLAAGEDVQPLLQSLLAPIGQDLRASINFFEHQHDRTISQVYLAGGAARSDFLTQSLQSELMAPCQAWNPASFLALELTPQKRAELEGAAGQLAVAIGAAIAAF